MATAYVGLGSNIEPRRQHLGLALKRLSFQQQVVGVRIVRAALLDPFPIEWREPDTERIGDTVRDVRLDLQNVEIWSVVDL